MYSLLLKREEVVRIIGQEKNHSNTGQKRAIQIPDKVSLIFKWRCYLDHNCNCKSMLAGLSDGQGNEGRVGTYDNEDLAMKDQVGTYALTMKDDPRVGT